MRLCVVRSVQQYQGYPQLGRVDVFAAVHSIVHAAVAHVHRLLCSPGDTASVIDGQSAAQLLQLIAEHVCAPLRARCETALRQQRGEKLFDKWKTALDVCGRDAASLNVAMTQRHSQRSISAAYRCSESFAHLARFEHESVARLLWRYLTDEELLALRDAHIDAAQPHVASSMAWMASKLTASMLRCFKCALRALADLLPGHPVVYTRAMLASLKLEVSEPPPAVAAPTAVSPVRAPRRGSRKGSADYLLHLIVSYACPWSARALLVRAMCGLERVVSVSVLSPQKAPGGEWVFDTAHRFDGCDVRDSLFEECTTLADVYHITQPPQWNERATVPMLIDRKSRVCVSNSSLDIVRVLGSMAGANSKVCLRPESVEKRIDPVVANITAGMIHCVYARACVCVCVCVCVIRAARRFLRDFR